MNIRTGQEQDRRGIAETIVEAFYDQFKALTTDKDAVAAGLTPMLHPERFTVAVDEQGAVVGTVAVSAAVALRDEFYRPKVFSPGQAQLDFVAVREHARGQRLAQKMLEHLLGKGKYALYTLDVVEGNEHVMPLYQSLGFQETGQEKEKNAWAKGFHFRHMMAYRPDTSA